MWPVEFFENGGARQKMESTLSGAGRTVSLKFGIENLVLVGQIWFRCVSSSKIRSLDLYMGFSSPPRTQNAPKHEKKLSGDLQTLGIDAAREYSKF